MALWLLIQSIYINIFIFVSILFIKLSHVSQNMQLEPSQHYIIATYSSIRHHDNIVLVAGSGFGGSDDTWPYLTGDWSKEFGVEPMPFNGFLFASRIMVAKEVHTSPSIKDLMVAAAGVDDSQWEGTYVKDTGGVITVRSELGEPIHKVNNRALMLWKEYDDSVLKLPREKRSAWLLEHRAEVIKRFNADYFKPWCKDRTRGELGNEHTTLIPTPRPVLSVRLQSYCRVCPCVLIESRDVAQAPHSSSLVFNLQSLYIASCRLPFPSPFSSPSAPRLPPCCHRINASPVIVKTHLSSHQTVIPGSPKVDGQLIASPSLQPHKARAVHHPR